MPTNLANPNRPEVLYPDYLTSGSITSQALAPTPTLDFKTPQTTPAYPVATMPPAPVAMTQPETQASSVNKRLQGLQERLVGQSAYRGQQEQAFGLPGLETTVSDLTSQLEGLKAEAAAIPLQLENRNAGYASVGATQRQSQAALRENAIKALSVSSLLNAANRRLTTAQAQADRAVAQRFDPVKEEIAAVTANLDLILKSPEYSTAEKARAEQQKAAQEARARTIEKAENANKEGIARAAAAVTNNPGNQAALLAAQQVIQLDPTAPDYMAKVFELVGPYQANAAETAYKNAQTQKLLAEAREATAAGAGVTPTAGGSSPFVAQPNYARLNAKQKVQADSLNNLVRTLKDYRDTYDQRPGLFGGVAGNLFGADSALLQTKVNAIIFAAAQAEGTGALQAADREVIERIIPNPTSVTGAFNTLIKGGKAGNLAKLDDQIQKYADNLANYGLQPVMPPQTGTTNDQYAGYRSQLQPGEVLVMRNGQIMAVMPEEVDEQTDTQI